MTQQYVLNSKVGSGIFLVLIIRMLNLPWLGDSERLAYPRIIVPPYSRRV